MHGYFLDSCEWHCFFSYERPIADASGLTPLQAFASWYDGLQAVLLRQIPYQPIALQTC